MRIQSERAGIAKKMDSDYYCFIPYNISDININVDEELEILISKAYLLLGKLDGMAITIPDVDLFVSMYVQKEATISVQIEGTQVSLRDVLQKDISYTRIKDTEDVVNYVKSMKYGIEKLEELPLCIRLLRELHSILLSDVRGSEKLPGEIRRFQNWIGHAGCNLNTARFVPPNQEFLNDLLSDLEKYINNNNVLDLIKIALIHYQFETIHPFLDGNGRLGRLLIILYLKDKGLIQYPVLYISYYFKQHRTKYYELLTNVREKGEFEEWIKFFMQGIIEVSENTIKSIQDIISLKNQDIDKIYNLVKGNITNIMKVYNYLLHHPYVTSENLNTELDISLPTINKVLKELETLGILSLVENKQRYKKYVYTEYVNILTEGTSL